jgi:hypothetical protein
LERGQRVDNLETGRPEVRASVERARRFLALTALLAAVLAGVAIALGTRRFVERHLDGCAVMRCLGATQGKLLGLYGAEFALLAAGACATGVVLGYLAQTAIGAALAGLLRSELAPAKLPPRGAGLPRGAGPAARVRPAAPRAPEECARDSGDAPRDRAEHELLSFVSRRRGRLRRAPRLAGRATPSSVPMWWGASPPRCSFSTPSHGPCSSC